MEKSFDTGELIINYEETPSEKPPLVLLHGLSAWHEELRRLHAGLAENWHVYALDLRGHGRSGRGDTYLLADYMRDVVAFIRHLNEPVVVMGHSLGAMTAIATAAGYPAGVRALIALDPPLMLRDPAFRIGEGSDNWFSWVYETMKDAPSYEQVVARCREKLPADVDDAEITRVAEQISRVAPGTVAVAMNNTLLSGYDLTEALHRITCPSLLLYGDWEQGAAVRPEDAEYFESNIALSAAVKIPDVGHLFPIHQPEIVLWETAVFLAGM